MFLAHQFLDPRGSHARRQRSPNASGISPRDGEQIFAHARRLCQGALVLEVLRDRDSLLRATNGDAYVRWQLDPDSPVIGYRRGNATVWSTRSPTRGLRWLYALGTPADTAALATESVDLLDEPPYGLTTTRVVGDLLSDKLRPVEFDEWDWWWLDRPPPAQAGEEEVAWEADEPALADFLEVASPRRSADPGDRHVQRWCSIRDDAGIAACAAELHLVPGVPHLASIAVRPDRRGLGLGGAVTAWITRQVLAEESPVVTLGMYADNEPARRVYRRLGYRDEHHLMSGRTPYGDVRASTRTS